jgi:hypothetical protein
MSVEELSLLLLPALRAPVCADALPDLAQRRLAAVLQTLPDACNAQSLDRLAREHPNLLQAAVAALLEYALRNRLLPGDWLGVPHSYTEIHGNA